MWWNLRFVLPLLLLILAGMADIGRAFNSYMVITNAAREGARAASRSSATPLMPPSERFTKPASSRLYAPR